jgi:hypothetical protein
MKSARVPVRLSLLKFGCLVLVGSVFCAGASNAQGPQPHPSKKPLPDSPAPKTTGVEGKTENVTAEFMGYMTNRSFFFPNIASSPGPLSTGEKFKLFVNESVSPSNFLTSGISAGFNQAIDSPHDYGQGASGYFSRFGASMGRGASNSFFGAFVLASVLHQDPRYFPHSNPTFWHSIKYAAKRVVVTRKDNGENTFNTSGIVGILAGETLANTYLPRSEQSGADTLKRFGSDLGWQFAGNVFKEYWPTLFKSMGLNRLKVVPEPNTPSP